MEPGGGSGKSQPYTYATCMSLLGGLEHRLERAVEGFFARLFRSSVHPVEIGKRIFRVMEDGKTVALRKVYAPNVYRIVLSEADFANVSGLQSRLVEDLETFVSEAALKRGWTLVDSPRVSLESSPKLGRGEFRVEADAAETSARRRAPARNEPAVLTRTNSRNPTLVVVGDEGPVQTVNVNGRIGIGRHPGNELVLPDPGASRHHAEVICTDDGVVLRDLGSTNGTFVNGSPVREHRLRNGERIVIGQTAIEFRT